MRFLYAINPQAAVNLADKEDRMKSKHMKEYAHMSASKLKKHMGEEKELLHEKKQHKKDKMDESLGMRHGKESKHKQSMADRRHEAEKAMHPHKKKK